jgi:hypothetical protein
VVFACFSRFLVDREKVEMDRMRLGRATSTRQIGGAERHLRALLYMSRCRDLVGHPKGGKTGLTREQPKKIILLHLIFGSRRKHL